MAVNQSVKEIIMSVTSIKELILVQVESIAQQNQYDMVYEQNDAEQLLVQIIKRDFEGDIIATVLSFHLRVDEGIGTGELIYYHQYGEFKKQEFNVFQQGSLPEVLAFISDRLSQWKRK